MALKALCEVNAGDPYALLGVPPAAGPEAVRAAWLALVKVSHPDRWPAPELVQVAHNVTAALNDARALLSDPARRRKYDLLHGVKQTLCSVCEGKGTVLKQKGFGKKVASTCPACKGSGSGE